MMHVCFVMVVVMSNRDRRVRLRELVRRNRQTLRLGWCRMRWGERRVLDGNFLMKRFNIERRGLDRDIWLCVVELVMMSSSS